MPAPLGALALGWALSACGAGEPLPPPRAPLPPPPPAAEPAAAGPRQLTLRYVAPPECPDASVYSEHVRSRASRLEVAPEGEVAPDAVDVRVEAAPDTGDWRGRLSIEGEKALEREVHGERCEDVIAALALITVLRFEGAPTEPPPPGAEATPDTSRAAGEARAEAGTASTAPRAAPPATPPAPGPPAPELPGPTALEGPEPAPSAEPGGAEPEPPAPEAPLPVAPEPAAEAPAPEIVPEPVLPEPEAVAPARPDVATEPPGDEAAPAPASGGAATDGASEPEAPDAGAEASEQTGASVPWSWPPITTSLTLHAGYASVPDHALRAALGGELRFGESRSSWALQATLAAARGSARTALADSELSLFTAQLGVCAPAFGDQPVWVRACASARAGALRVGVRPRDPSVLRFTDEQAWGTWIAAGPAVQVGVPIAEHWTARGLLELAVQLVRDRFHVAGEGIGGAELPPIIVYRPEPASVEAGLGVEYAF